MLNRRAFQIALLGGVLVAPAAMGQTPDVDPTHNTVVFDIAGRDVWISDGLSRADDCVQQIWAHAPVDIRAAAARVRRIFSEWEPSAADKQFIERTFPRVYLTWTFTRPGHDGWDAAFASARAQLEQALARRR
jgi:hypothetical protein